MSDSIEPESRIFRIGRECYVVYLGRERDDVKPFLRIGSTWDIPDEVHEAVSTTVITDDHLGSPLLEILAARKFKGRYLGDTAVVETMERFFKSFNLPTDELTDYSSFKDGEGRHMVWFYSSGNIHLRYEDRVIFDLHLREKEDGHFVTLFDKAKAEFIRNPLRFIRGDFSGPGVILTGADVLWFQDGELLSLKARSGFFPRLMQAGIDPDMITASAYDLREDEMESREAAVFVGFLKRKRQRRKALKVFTSEPELARKLRLLFPAMGETPAALEAAEVSDTRRAAFREAVVGRRNVGWKIHYAGLPDTVLDADAEDALIIDSESSSLGLGGARGAALFRVPPGMPVNLIAEEPPTVQLGEKYIASIMKQIRGFCSDGEFAALTALERYIRGLHDNAASGRTDASRVLKDDSASVRSALRRSSISAGSLSWFVFSNARALLGRISAAAEKAPAENAQSIIAALGNLLERSSPPEPHFPFFGDFYLGGPPLLLWRPAKRIFSAADIAAAKELNANIRRIALVDESEWSDELQRLLQLIRSLGNAGEGPLTEKELALLTQPESEPPAPKKPRPKPDTPRKPAAPKDSAESADAPPAARDAKPAGGGTAGVIGGIIGGGSGARRSVPSRKRKRIWPLVLPAAAALLLIAALIWDFSGSAPWGRVTRSTLPAAAALGGSGADVQGGGRAGEDGSGGALPGTSDSADDPGAAPGTDNENSSGETAPGTDESSAERGTGTSSARDDSIREDSAGSEETAARSSALQPAGGAVDDPAIPSDGTPGAEGSPDSRTPEVDVDQAPRTPEDAGLYLSVNDRVLITEADIHLAANEIAVLNGYKDLDYRVFTGSDPDWIFPGYRLGLPDGGEYTVRSGDTIWFLAAREVRIDVEKDLAAFDRALEVLDNTGSNDADRSGAVELLRGIAGGNRAAALRRMAAEALSERRF